MVKMKEKMKKMADKKVIIFLIFGIILLSIIPILSAQDSESSSEWWMFMKYLNHTAWDGVNFTKISGLDLASYTAGDVIYSSPAVADGYVYIGSGNISCPYSCPGGVFYQLNASNVSQLISIYTTGDSIHSSPAVANGYVYIGSLDNGLYQLNASNVSQLIASYDTGEEIYSSPVVANGYVYVGNINGDFFQLNASNVSQLVASSTLGTIVSSPAIANGYVYILGFDGTVYQLNASDVSQLIASGSAGGSENSLLESSPVVANSYVYIGGNDDDKVYQLNATDVSQLIATYTTGGDVFSSPAVADGYVYVGSLDNKLYQLNASNISQEIASYTTGDDVYSSPSVVNGYVYVISDRLYQLDASNVSQQIANYTVGEALGYSSPAIANDYVYVGSQDWKVYQLNADLYDIGKSINTTPVNNQKIAKDELFTFNISINKTLVWCGLSIDGNENITMNLSSSNLKAGYSNASLNLDYGKHTAVFSCNYTGRDHFYSTSVNFSINNRSIWYKQSSVIYINDSIHIGAFDKNNFTLTMWEQLPSKPIACKPDPAQTPYLIIQALDNITQLGEWTKYIAMGWTLSYPGYKIDYFASMSNGTGSGLTTKRIDYLLDDPYDTRPHLLVLSVDRNSPTGLKLYYDGQLVNSTDPRNYSNENFSTSEIPSQAQDNWGGGIYINQGDTCSLVYPRLDEIRVYNGVALNSTQVSDIYNHRIGKTVDETEFASITGIGAYMEFDEVDPISGVSYYTFLVRKLLGGIWSNETSRVYLPGNLRSIAGGLPYDDPDLSLAIISPITSQTSQIVDFNISSNKESSWCGLSLDGSANITMALNSSSTGAGYANSTMIEGSHTVVFTCNDTEGYLDIEQTSFVVDLNYPLISISYPENTTYNINVSELNYTFTEANPAGCWYSLNGGVNSSYNTTCSNFTGLTSIEGSNTWTVYINDSVGNLNSSLITFFKDTIAPEISLVYPSNGTTYGSSSINFNITATDDAGISSCLYTLTNGVTNYTMSNTTTSAFNATNTSIADGSYTAKFYCNDIFNNVNGTQQIIFIIDRTSPNATLISPLNNTYNSSTSINFTYNVSDNLGVKNSTLYVYNETGQYNVTSTNFVADTLDSVVGVVVNLIDGVYQWWVELWDFGGNTFSSQNNTLTIDTVTPLITISSPLNQSYNTNQILINFTADSYSSLWYYNGTSNRSYTSEETIIVDEGSNTFIFYANDSAGNLNETSITFFVDSIYPVISIAYPANTTYNTNVSVLNYTRSDASFVGCWYSLNGGDNSSYDSTCSNFTELTSVEGSNTWTVYINDSVGNLNYSSVTFTKDTTAPVISLISPANSASSTETLWTFSFNVTDNNNVNCSLILDNAIVNLNSSVNITGGINFFTNTTAIGSHSWSINCTDSANNKANSSTRSFTVTSTTPDNDHHRGGGGGGGGGLLNRTYNINESQLKNGYTNLFGKLDILKFKVNNENHSLKIDNIDTKKKTVSLTVSSEKQTKTLSLREEWKINLNRDNYSDIYIKLNNITNSKANLTIKSIYELIPGGKHDEKKDEKNENRAVEKKEITVHSEKPGIGFIQSYWIYLLLAIFFLIIILTIMKIKLLFLYSINEKEWYFIEKK